MIAPPILQMITGTGMIVVIDGDKPKNEDGTDNILIRVIGQDDQQAFSRMKRFLDRAIKDAGLSPKCLPDL